MPAEERLEYAIRRLNWRRTHYGIVRMPGFVPVGALPSFEEAEADRARREAEVRERITNPFVCGPNHAARSRLPEPIFCDWLRDVGIEPPAEQPLNWAGWWDEVRACFSAEQVAHVWAGLDRVRFFEVVARPEGRIGYAVVSIEWVGADQLFPGPEGGTPLMVFRRWTDAEAYYRESEEAMRQARGDSMTYFSINRWEEELFWPLGPAERRLILTSGDSAPFYEVAEIELPDALATNGASLWQVFVVGRVAWTVEPRGGGFTAFEPNRTENPYGPDHRCVPVAAFAGRNVAEAWMRERELEAARLFNPFWRVGPTSVPRFESCAATRDRLKELVGPVPDESFGHRKQAGWRTWWDEHVPTWSDETLAAVWELFDRVRFYDVLELDVR
jgi:hypothetical protein